MHPPPIFSLQSSLHSVSIHIIKHKSNPVTFLLKYSAFSFSCIFFLPHSHNCATSTASPHHHLSSDQISTPKLTMVGSPRSDSSLTFYLSASSLAFSCMHTHAHTHTDTPSPHTSLSTQLTIYRIDSIISASSTIPAHQPDCLSHAWLHIDKNASKYIAHFATTNTS